MSLYKTKSYSQPKYVTTKQGGGKKPSKLKILKQFEDNIIKNIRNLFKLTKENKAIEDRILRDTKTFLNGKKKIITNQ